MFHDCFDLHFSNLHVYRVSRAILYHRSLHVEQFGHMLFKHACIEKNDGRILCQNKIIIIDACHSSAIKGVKDSGIMMMRKCMHQRT